MRHGVLEIAVRFGDCDPAGIVFYANFFRWFDAACWQTFAERGFTRRTLADRYGVIGWPIVSTSAQFRNPATEGDLIRVETTIGRFGASSFDLAYRIVRGDVLVCEGAERRVWAARVADDARRLAPRRIPDEVRAAFAAGSDGGLCAGVGDASEG